MYERLEPKEIARIKLQKRKERIRRIRQFVATGSVSLVALFSGVLLTRSFISQTNSGTPTAIASALPSVPFVGDENEGSNDDLEESDSEQVSPVTSTPTPAPAPAPTPAPVTTSQS